MTEKFDIIIVGAGPAGSTLAKLLSRKYSIGLIDKDNFPRKKPCAGWITHDVFNALNIKYEDSPFKIEELDKITIQYKNKKYTTEYNHPHSFGILRENFDYSLLRLALENGAHLIKDKVEDFEIKDNNVTVNNMKYSSKLIIGAGGNFCPISRKFNIKDKIIATSLVKEIPSKDKSEPLIWFPKDLNGYGWHFPKLNYTNVGIGCMNNVLIQDKLFEFIKDTNLSKEGFIGSAYRINNFRDRNIVGDKFILLGDSAGFASDFSGEGIFPAIKSSNIAAEVILENVNNLKKYQEICLKEFPKQKKVPFAKTIFNLALKTQRSRKMLLKKTFNIY